MYLALARFCCDIKSEMQNLQCSRDWSHFPKLLKTKFHVKDLDVSTGNNLRFQCISSFISEATRKVHYKAESIDSRNSFQPTIKDLGELYDVKRIPRKLMMEMKIECDFS